MYLEKSLRTVNAAPADSPALYATIVSYFLISLFPTTTTTPTNYDANVGVRSKIPVILLSQNPQMAIATSGRGRSRKLVFIFLTELCDWQVLVNDASAS